MTSTHISNHVDGLCLCCRGILLVRTCGIVRTDPGRCLSNTNGDFDMQNRNALFCIVGISLTARSRAGHAYACVHVNRGRTCVLFLQEMETKRKREDKLSYETRPAGSEYALVHATLDRSVCEA